MNLKGDNIELRALEPSDLDYILMVENDESLWHLGDTVIPFSKDTIARYLENVHQDIYEVKQVRLMIQSNDGHPLGLIDLFDFHPYHNRAGVGILISNNQERGKGYGFEALKLLIKYAFDRIGLHQLYANVTVDNTASSKIFEKAGFEIVGTKKAWTKIKGHYVDEHLYQLLNEN